MDQIVQQFIAHSLAQSTKASYHSAFNCYLVFCYQFNFPSLPLSQEKVARFVAHLATTGIAYQSIRVYLSTICFLQIFSRLPDPSYLVVFVDIYPIHRLAKIKSWITWFVVFTAFLRVPVCCRCDAVAS